MGNCQRQLKTDDLWDFRYIFLFDPFLELFGTFCKLLKYTERACSILIFLHSIKHHRKSRRWQVYLKIFSFVVSGQEFIDFQVRIRLLKRQTTFMLLHRQSPVKSVRLIRSAVRRHETHSIFLFMMSEEMNVILSDTMPVVHSSLWVKVVMRPRLETLMGNECNKLSEDDGAWKQ